MNADSFDKLWQVPGVAKVTGKEDAPAQYQDLLNKAIKKGKKNCRTLTYIVMAHGASQFDVLFLSEKSS